MNKATILVIGRNEAFIENLLKLINDNAAWSGMRVSTDEEAIERFHLHPFDVVVLTNDIGKKANRKLRKIFIHQYPDTIILQHDLVASNFLLLKEIHQALNNRNEENKPRISFVDDALKNARLNISIQ